MRNTLCPIFKILILQLLMALGFLKTLEAWGVGILPPHVANNFNAVRLLLEGKPLIFYVIHGSNEHTQSLNHEIRQVLTESLRSWEYILLQANIIEKNKKWFEVKVGYEKAQLMNRDPLENEFVFFFLMPDEEQNKDPYFLKMRPHVPFRFFERHQRSHHNVMAQFFLQDKDIQEKHKENILACLMEIGHLFGIADNYLIEYKKSSSYLYNFESQYLPGQVMESVFSWVYSLNPLSLGENEVVGLQLIKKYITDFITWEKEFFNKYNYLKLTFFEKKGPYLFDFFDQSMQSIHPEYTMMAYNRLFSDAMATHKESIFTLPKKYYHIFQYNGKNDFVCAEESNSESNNTILQISFDFSGNKITLNGEISYKKDDQYFKYTLTDPFLRFGKDFDNDTYISSLKNFGFMYNHNISNFAEKISFITELEQESKEQNGLLNFRFGSIDAHAHFWMVSFKLWEDGPTKYIMCQPINSSNI